MKPAGIKNINKRLKFAREFAGLSQKQAAALMKMHRPTISEIEAGRRKVSSDELNRFADIYKVGVNWLLNGPKDASLPRQEKISLAARELSKLKTEDVDLLLDLLKTLKLEPNESLDK